MKIDFSDYRSEPREMSDRTIDLVSTSTKTADASPIILNRTKRIQTKFEPALIDNDKEPAKCVSGKLIYEKKREKESEFPTDKLTRQSVKVGELMEISLDTSETYNLFCGLKALYKLHEDLGTTPLGSTTYTKVDSSFRQFYSIIQSDPSAARMLGQSENFDLVKLLLQLITKSESLDALKNSLSELEQSNVSVLTNAINVERLERVLSLLEDNAENGDEEFWQNLFAENQWILSQLFACPCTIFEEKAYVGGKGISNNGGNVCDFIYQNNLTQNIALIEIKTPCTPLFGNSYRCTYSLSADMSGAINQILNYKDKLSKDYYSNCHNSNESFEVLSPKCFLIIGMISHLNTPQIAALENYRNNLNNVTIITYDELIQRVKDTLAIFSSNDNTSENDNLEEVEDWPF